MVHLAMMKGAHTFIWILIPPKKSETKLKLEPLRTGTGTGMAGTGSKFTFWNRLRNRNRFKNWNRNWNRKRVEPVPEPVPLSYIVMNQLINFSDPKIPPHFFRPPICQKKVLLKRTRRDLSIDTKTFQFRKPFGPQLEKEIRACGAKIQIRFEN